MPAAGLPAAVLAALWAVVLCQVEFLELHGPDGQRVYVNEYEISSLRQPTSVDLRRFFPSGVHCVVVTGNGKFIGVVETCPTIRDLIEAKQR